MFRNEEIKTINVIVKCDGCGSEKKIGENLGWDARMNACLAHGYTFKVEGGAFKNYCGLCK
ncbi:hypothetical protein [Paenibacillus sinopodophylli]|uniref:hypothetical protein n=1 Tax=Paenibacillus sinopodophylli TaxID=1837342 RepID=UPI00110CD63B|nr:hypothetical protein [Paenibacillus sinopodophylli]